MDFPRLGVFAFLDTLPAADTVDLARVVERLGYGVLWLVEAAGRDAYAHAGHLLAATDRLVVGSGVASMWTRSPAQAMAAARTHAEASNGRFVLGLGVNNAMSGTLRGFEYRRPVDAMRDYLAAMHAAPYAAPAADPPIVLAALQPRMLALAAARTSGTLTYFSPTAHTARARASIGAGWVCVTQAVVLESDPAIARATARAYMDFYVHHLPVYQTHLRSFGFDDDDFGTPISDRLVDAIVAWGDADRIRTRVEEQFSAGASHVALLPLGTGGGNAPDRRTLEALARGMRSIAP